MTGFFEYHDGDTFFHRLNPLTKLALALTLCAAAFACRDPFSVLAVIALDIAAAFAAGVTAVALGLLKGLLKLSAVLFAVQTLFISSGNVLFTLPLIGVPVTDEGVIFSLTLALKLAAAALPLGVMLCVTRLRDITNALVERLGVPYKYAFALTSAIRFAPVLAGELECVIQAQTARGVEFDTKNPFKKAAILIPLCVPLLISSVRKTDACALSAELRGFKLRTRECGFRHYAFRAGDGVCAAFCAAVFTACALI